MEGHVFRKLEILPLLELRQYNLALIIYKALHEKAPLYIRDLFIASSNDDSRFILPLPRVDIFKSHCISFCAAKFWNSLPTILRQSSISILRFKTYFKKTFIDS